MTIFRVLNPKSLCVEICLRTGAPVFGSPVEIFTGTRTGSYGNFPVGLRLKGFEMKLWKSFQKFPAECHFRVFKGQFGNFVKIDDFQSKCHF